MSTVPETTCPAGLPAATVAPLPELRFFFCWKLHGSTKFVVRAVALLSAKRSEKESFKMIMGFNKLCMYQTTKT